MYRYFNFFLSVMLSAMTIALPVPAFALVVNSQSSASTGGQTVTGGQSAVTGDSSASAQSTTIINANDNGGTINVDVETKSNGVESRESVKKSFTAGEEVNVDVATTSPGAKSTVQISLQPPSSTTSSSLAASTSAEDEIATTTGLRTFVYNVFANLLAKLSSWFPFF